MENRKGKQKSRKQRKVKSSLAQFTTPQIGDYGRSTLAGTDRIKTRKPAEAGFK